MKEPKIIIAGREISRNYPPYVIAELSANHNGNFEKALKIINEAASAGADAVKLQTYRPDTITLDSDTDEFIVKGGLWDGRTLFDLYQEAHLPWEWHKPLFEHAKAVGITMFSSPFDTTAVDLLEDLNAPAYKIASFEAVDLQLIRYVAATGKPMIISTGMADRDEIQEAIDAAKEGGCKELAILHCVSGYPAPAANYNIRTLADMVDRYGLVTGLSDHTLDNTTAICSVVMGGSIIEKHFTLDRKGGGPDDSFSMEPRDLKNLVDSVFTAYQCLGEVDYGLKSSEVGNIKFRRSLYFVKDLKVDDIITADSIRSVRPGYGVAPRYFDKLVGKRVCRDIEMHQPVTLDDFYDLSL